MTSPFQTELRDRAAAHAREWEAARDPSVGLVEVEATVRRRRRGRGLLVGAGSVALVGLVASVASVAGGGGSVPAGPSGSVAAEPIGSVLEALAGVEAGDVVLTVDDELPNPSGFTNPYSVLVVDAGGRLDAEISHADITAALGSTADQWPTISLLAVDPRGSRALFMVDNPVGYTTPHVAILSLTSGDVEVVDPCASPLNSIDLSGWCPGEPTLGGGTVIDLGTGSAIQMPAYQACSGPSARLDGMVLATCEAAPGESYLVSVDPATGEVVSQTALGMAPIQAPLVVGGGVYANAFSTEGDQILVSADGTSPQVGGAAVAGVAVLGDRLLVQTETDKFGVSSTYGKSLGMWSPTTGDFTKLYTLDDAAAVSVTLVPVLP